ncbi:MAG: aminopeptidase P family protein [Algoriphagus sp.]|jgi:Xaa-Pro dipeptidase|uniref:M24 family metallopeptidase n=2 Tax=Algoriphagus sp. TaxID=1872435 RepID=UPI0027560BF4|nr:aminopeptidase P family protein [Algoriphagus sp.]MDP4747204.1 aminopeptidase P family protein [Algoriphagus sp.]MDP4838017.1 aminopeptidase P family protein [Algoriphagus sp.]MDP4956121.1 aminopeptidase P family protein [Algoriphagus sp.]MDP5126420.1 aminopeptidase P family protein [Algoriphagus sp.]
MRLSILLLGIVLLSWACTPSPTTESAQEKIDPITYWGENPWPEIRKKRINQLLPEALKNADVASWLVVCRENYNDPIATHVGGENASGTAAFLFYTDETGFHSLAFSPEGEAKALEDLAIHEKVERIPRGESAVARAVAFIKEKGFSTIAINTSASNEMADGLTHSQHQELASLMGSDVNKLVSSEKLVYEWLSIKLAEEVEILKKAAQLASDFQEEAYAKIIPGKTTDAEVAKFLKAKMAEYGVTDAWHPDQNPNVNSGPDRGHSHATDKIIQPGDVIQTDFGVKLYGIWVSDIQRFAYVLKEGESSAPKEIQQYWENGKAGSRIALAAMKPGIKGEDVDRAQRDLMDANGSLYVPWSTGHPVGYVAHDVGPNLGGARLTQPRPAAQKLLKKGMVFAFDGFHCWKQADGTEKTISVEEMAVVNENGATYLISPQEDLILVGKK